MPFSRQRYHEYLESKEWQEFRQSALCHADFQCERCGDEHNLEIHHKHYETLGHESLNDVEVVCQSCHPEADRERRMGLHETLCVEVGFSAQNDPARPPSRVFGPSTVLRVKTGKLHAKARRVDRAVSRAELSEEKQLDRACDILLHLHRSCLLLSHMNQDSKHLRACLHRYTQQIMAIGSPKIQSRINSLKSRSYHQRLIEKAERKGAKPDDLYVKGKEAASNLEMRLRPLMAVGHPAELRDQRSRNRPCVKRPPKPAKRRRKGWNYTKPLNKRKKK
jgi:hypothetical protein